MKNIKSLILSLITLSLLTVTSAAYAQVDIGGGNSCKDKKAYNSKNKVITVTKVTNTIDSLKEKAKNQKGDKKAATQAKITEQKALKTLIKSCNKGTIGGGGPSATPTPGSGGGNTAKVFSDLPGAYSGTYSGTHALLGPISGTMTANFTLSGTTFSGTIIFTETISIVLNKLEFSKNVSGLTPPVSFIAPSTNLGDITVVISSNGNITATNAKQDLTVNFNSALSGNQITGGLNGDYAGVYDIDFTVNR